MKPYKKNLTTLDTYMNRVFKILIITLPFTALLAGVLFTIFKLCGFYETVDLNLVIIFDVTNVLYLIAAIFFFLYCEDSNKQLKKKVVFAGKIFILAVEIIQWNFISYMIPSRDFWAFSIFFIFLTVFFIDYKFTATVAASIVVSMIISWIIKPDVLLPARDNLFLPNMFLRGAVLLQCINGLILFVFVLNKIFVTEIEKNSEFDPLTHLRSRRTLESILNTAIEDNKKSGLPFCVLMCDIDDFKKVNDTYGHSCGDVVLTNIANIFLFTIGDKGVTFRYGGEEIFSVLYIDEKEAIELVETIKERINELTTVYDGHPIKVTMTFGVSRYIKNYNVDKMIKAADSNLYYGKNHGKNCVIH